jgi:hypothetical protein
MIHKKILSFIFLTFVFGILTSWVIPSNTNYILKKPGDDQIKKSTLCGVRIVIYNETNETITVVI